MWLFTRRLAISLIAMASTMGRDYANSCVDCTVPCDSISATSSYTAYIVQLFVTLATNSTTALPFPLIMSDQLSISPAMKRQPLRSLSANKRLQTQDPSLYLETKSDFSIDLSMDRETRRRKRHTAGRSGGIFQPSPFATNPWDIQYADVMPTEWSSSIDLDGKSTQYPDNGLDNDIADPNEDFVDDHASSNIDQKNDTKETVTTDNALYIDLMTDEEPEIRTATKHTLLSALPVRLNLRKLEGLNTHVFPINRNQQKPREAYSKHKPEQARPRLPSPKLKHLQHLTDRLQKAIQSNATNLVANTTDQVCRKPELAHLAHSSERTPLLQTKVSQCQTTFVDLAITETTTCHN